MSDRVRLEDPNPIDDSVTPRADETFEEWNTRIMRLLKEFRTRRGTS